MAAAATLAHKRLEKKQENETKLLSEMTDVERIRHGRKLQRKINAAGSSLALYKINKQMNLDAHAWNVVFRPYINFAHVCDDVAQSSMFGNFILLCIIVAGALVGIQTYDGFEDDPTVQSVDFFILVMFTIEVTLKIIGEGMGPWNYFIGPEYAWNIFDFSIVLLSMPFIPFAGSQLKLLRLIRLMRLAKAFRKIPQLQMIMMGLVGGLQSIIYIVILMLLIFYLYACAGILFFKENDPFHFQSVEVSMLTLLGVATLDGWGEIMFLNYFGCDVYNGGFYTDEESEADNRTGGVTWCGTPVASPTISAAYFISFIVIAAFCILSLFIGAVAMSMVESMQDMKKTSREVEDKKISKMRDDIVRSMDNKELLDRKAMRRLRLIELAFQGEDVRVIEHETEHGGHGDTGWAEKYRKLAYFCQDLGENAYFGQFITSVIILAGVTVGMSTDPKMNHLYSDVLEVLDVVIQYIFLSEIIIKTIGEEYHPLRYFNDPWNCFDFIVVAGSFMPFGGGLVTILRLLRLLRVLKLLRALPQLQVIVAALMKGLSAIAFISVILGIFYYFFAIIALTFFGENDQWHFANLHMAMLALFQCSTMDNWSAVMWISLYGCDVQDGDHPELCTSPSSSFMLASFFFLIIILVGALVLLTLFIGVVGMSMEEASQEQKKEKEIEERAMIIGEVEELDEQSVRLFKEVFDSLDLIQCTRVGSEEMKFGLTLAGLNLDEQEFQEVWSKVDRDNSNGIDFAEFLEFMCDLKSNLRRLTEEEDDENSGSSATGPAPPMGRRQFTFMDKAEMKTKDDEKASNQVRAGLGLAKRETADMGFSRISEKAELEDLEGVPNMPILNKPHGAWDSPSKTAESDKQKAFSLGRDMNQAAKKYETPGRGGNDSPAPDGNPRVHMQHSPDTETQSRQQGQSPLTPQASGNGKRSYGSYSPSGPVMNKQQVSPDGQRHHFTVSRAQSSFEKVALGGGADDGDGPESNVRIRNSPNGKSPYAPGSAVKKPVKSLVVSI